MRFLRITLLVVLMLVVGMLCFIQVGSLLFGNCGRNPLESGRWTLSACAFLVLGFVVGRGSRGRLRDLAIAILVLQVFLAGFFGAILDGGVVVFLSSCTVLPLAIVAFFLWWRETEDGEGRGGPGEQCQHK